MKSTRACPHCDSDRIKPQGTVAVLQGEVRAAYRCLACGRHFDLTVRAAAIEADRRNPSEMAYLIRCSTCEFHAEHLTRAAAADAALRHSEETQHDSIEIEDASADADRQNGGNVVHE